jgi:allophanate hydrolase subunit 2
MRLGSPDSNTSHNKTAKRSAKNGAHRGPQAATMEPRSQAATGSEEWKETQTSNKVGCAATGPCRVRVEQQTDLRN